MSEYHIPVLLEESINGLNLQPNGIYVDVTYGGGGHSLRILEQLEGGKLVAFDQDEDALQNLIDDERLIFVNHNFKFLKNFLRYHGISKVDGILADLGVSSHDFDQPDRGFSFRFDGQLDMRMNQSAAKDAVTVINEYDTVKLGEMFREGLVAVDISGRSGLFQDLADLDLIAKELAFFVKKIVHLLFVEISPWHVLASIFFLQKVARTSPIHP